MVPYRGGDFLFTHIACSALKLHRFLGIEHIMKNLYMPFITLVKPAWPGLQVQNLFTFYINITYGMIRVI
jgi:hypothetical protein